MTTQATERGSEERPADLAGSPRRRSLRFEAELDRAHREQATAAVTGAGVHDLLVTRARHSLQLLRFLASYAADREIGVVTYSMSSGVCSHPTLPGGRAAAVRAEPAGGPVVSLSMLVEDLRAQSDPALLVLDYADGLLGAGGGEPSLEQSLFLEQLISVSADPLWHGAGLRMVLVDRGGGLHPRLTRVPTVRSIVLSRPDESERTLFVHLAKAARATAPLYLHDSLPPEQVGRLSGGLLNFDLHQLRRSTDPARPLTQESLVARKARAIADGSDGTLELMEDVGGFGDTVAGLPSVRLALRAAREAGRRTLRILLAGPPGTGKSLAATAIGHTLGVPVVRYGTILTPWLGEAEQNMRRAHHLLRDMAPVCLYIDEADQRGLGVRGSAHEHAANQNLRAELFELLGDIGADNGISVVAATNVPSRMDPAALSRFTVLPVLFGTAAEVTQVMLIHARRNQVSIDGQDLVDLMVRHLDRPDMAMSGRSAVALVERATDEALLAGSRTVTRTHVESALQLTVGFDWNAASEYSTLAALLAARSKTAWPWVAAQRLDMPDEIPAYLRPYLRAGELDVATMSARLAELERGGVFR